MSNCFICSIAGAFVLNGLNLVDHTLNWVLLGDANETVSSRIARARDAGMGWAANVCKALTAVQKVVTFGSITRDHCTFSLDPTVEPSTKEIVNLNTWPPTIRKNPVNESGKDNAGTPDISGD